MKDADLFIVRFRNIQVDANRQDMDMEHIDPARVRPAIYSPYQYYGVGEKPGEMGEWKKHFPDVRENASDAEKAKQS